MGKGGACRGRRGAGLQRRSTAYRGEGCKGEAYSGGKGLTGREAYSRGAGLTGEGHSLQREGGKGGVYRGGVYDF